jgi:Fe2+ transport system protein FeoA
MRYSENDAQQACAGCISAGPCAMVKCPNCGYEQPREMEHESFLSRLLGRRKKHKQIEVAAINSAAVKAPLRLDQAQEGVRAVVSKVATDDLPRLRKLLVMGILPGATISIDQRKPLLVVSIGASQFAMDMQMAESVFIQV